MTKESDAPSGGREFRIAELAKEARVSVRTVRFYRERRLLPPPRRDGRIGWYSEAHLARLRTIAALLERGHTLGGIAELIDAMGRGRSLETVAELLGLDGSLTGPGSWEAQAHPPPRELADAVRAAGREVRAHVDALADLFTVQVRTRLLETIGGEAVPSEAGRLAAALKSVHPLVKYVVEAELSRAVDRRVQAELDHWADGPALRPALGPAAP
ncbi:MerR family transcriptional regulator [Streptomyces sp. NPDC091371]|uniref:MerR family transcriptional regulator n=1 Tax=Streptomyces sp. NPDC091371 TaxID=3155303 RepID=UPI003426D3F0